MRVLGAITYLWHGEMAHAVTGPGLRIDLRDAWVQVSRPVGGTQLVAWEDVRSLTGWAAPSPMVRLGLRLGEPTPPGTNPLDSAVATTSLESKRHRAKVTAPEVRENTSTGEGRADEESGS